jgi:hypothetical protein
VGATRSATSAGSCSAPCSSPRPPRHAGLDRVYVALGCLSKVGAGRVAGHRGALGNTVRTTTRVAEATARGRSGLPRRTDTGTP